MGGWVGGVGCGGDITKFLSNKFSTKKILLASIEYSVYLFNLI